MNAFTNSETIHSALLASIATATESAMQNNPCICDDGLCDHCTRVAFLAVEAKTAYREFIARKPLVRRLVTVAA